VRPNGASPIRFYGSAQVVADPAVRDAVYERVIPEEQARDADKKGVAVLIRVDRIRQGPQSITR
jgi:formaldehyde-activating enzyme involved in methanogenesis